MNSRKVKRIGWLTLILRVLPWVLSTLWGMWRSRKSQAHDPPN